MQASDCVSQFFELLHDFVHRVAVIMLSVLMSFPFRSFRSLGNMFCDIVQSGLIQMFDGNVHVFQACDKLVTRSGVFMVRLMRKFPQFHFDVLSFTSDISKPFFRRGIFTQMSFFLTKLLQQPL